MMFFTYDYPTLYHQASGMAYRNLYKIYLPYMVTSVFNRMCIIEADDQHYYMFTHRDK